MVTSKLSSFAEKGDQFDIAVSSVGDARSLVGGTLVITPLYGVDEKIYAFAQGQLTVGGYDVDQALNSYRKNHQTVGRLVKGATLERAVGTVGGDRESINIILDNPDYTTASKVVDAIKRQVADVSVVAVHAGKIQVNLPTQAQMIEYVARLENVSVTPDHISNVVINEKTGTIVAGSHVVISAVSIAHGNLKVEIDTEYSVSQPTAGIFRSPGVETAVVPETTISVTEEVGRPIAMPEGTTVADLVAALNKINISTRDIITILQSIKTAGALHANLIIE
jgi:flagellar P-ring protein FlgI